MHPSNCFENPKVVSWVDDADADAPPSCQLQKE